MSKILVVEDNDSLRLLYKMELNRDGYEVMLASSGKEAMKKFKDFSPDIVVLDVCMPMVSGLEVMEHILNTDENFPIIINTAYDSYKSDVITKKAAAYIIKSSDLSELRIKIKEILTRRKKIRKGIFSSIKTRIMNVIRIIHFVRNY